MTTNSFEDKSEKVRRAIREVISKRGILSRDTYTQVLLALYDKLRETQTERDESIPHPQNAGQTDQIRLVTIMYIDVVNATQLAEKLGNEDWRTLIGESHRHLTDLVQQWDGEVGQYLGDGLLCYFGAQRSRGNDAARAVACALAMQQRLVEYEFRAQSMYNVDSFAVRIGISTGWAVVGLIGQAGHASTLAVGTTTNLASRLQTLAPPRDVVIDTETYLRVRSEFIAVEQDTVQLKGISEPVTYYLVLGAQHQPLTQLTTDRIGDILIPFVGRRTITERMLHMVEQTSASSPSAALTIYADIGLGKSRLLQEIAQSPEGQPFRIFRMVGHYERSEMPFSLIGDMVFHMCDLSHTLTTSAAEDQITRYTQEHWHGDPDNAQAAAAIIGYLAGYGFADTPYTLSLQRSSPNHNNQLAYHWLQMWIRGIAGEQPALILVDNLQWADNSSLQMLQHLLKESGVLLLAAARPEFHQREVSYMRDEDAHSTVTLPPLDEREAMQVIQAVLQHVDDVPNDLPRLIVDRAEGNPLFIEEFLRMLFDNGVFERDSSGERWTVNNFQYRMTVGELPSGLLGVFQARIDDLSGAVRRVVQVAAVVGHTFWGRAVSSIAGFDTTPQLEELMLRGIVLEKPRSRFEGDREFVFRNMLYHEVAYNMLPRVYRTTYHQQVALWLAERTAAKPDALGLLAEHYTQADMMFEALQTYVAAAEHQLERGLLAETNALVESGLFTARTVPRADALPFTSRLWLIQARTAHSRRSYSEATAASATALQLMDELPADAMPAERILAGVTLGNAYIALGSYDESEHALFQVEAQHKRSASDDNSSAEVAAREAEIQRAFGTLYWVQGDLDRAEMHNQQALNAAKRSQRQRHIAASFAMLGRIALDKGEFANALGYIEHVLEINRQTGNVLYQIADLRLIAVIRRMLFCYEQSLQALDAAERLAQQVRYDAPLLKVNRGLCYIGQGKHEAGLALMEEAFAQEYQSTQDRNEMRLAYLRALAQTGRNQQAAAAGKLFIEGFKAHNRVLYGRGLLWFGLVLYRQNQEQALTMLHEALENEMNYGGRDLWLCQYALSLVHPNTQKSREYRAQAVETLTAIAASLYRYPYIAATVSNPAHIAQVFDGWQRQTEPK